MSNKIEMEIKLVINKKNLTKFLAMPLLQSVQVSETSHTSELLNTYYDTSDYRLAHAGIAYRIRQKGTSYEATVKTQGENIGGFAARHEYNQVVEQNKPTLSGFGDKELEQELQELLAGVELQPIFTTTTNRQTQNLQITKTTLVEMAIDKGTITVGKKKVSIDEVELEILQGNKKDLLTFVAEMAQEVPFTVESKSKFLRGLELLDGVSGAQETELIVNKNGNVEVELKKIITYYIDSILTAQNSLEKKDIEAQADKLLLNNIKRLQAFLQFAAPLMSKEQCRRYGSLTKKLDQLLQNLYLTKRLQRQWQQLYKKSNSFLSNSAMSECLLQRQEEQGVAIWQQLSAGFYTKELLGLMAALEQDKWPQAKYLQLNQFLVHRYKEWRTQLMGIKVDDGKETVELAQQMQNIIEELVLIRDALKIPGLNKDNFAYLKVLVRNLKNLNYDVYGEKQIVALLQGTNSRVLYRDAGMLLGYRLSEQPLVWHKVLKNWSKVLQIFKKK